MANSVVLVNAQALSGGGGGLGAVTLSGTASAGLVPVATGPTTAVWGPPGSIPAPTPAITISTLLTKAAHANINIELNPSGPINIDVPDPTTCTVGDEFRGINNGSGVVTLRTHLGGTLLGSALLPTTVSQYDGWLVRLTSAGFRRLA
jgi:hypothetical protein